MRKYKQITKEQRSQIEVLLKQNTSKTKIAELLNVDRSTIYREVKRNKGKRVYRADIAQEESQLRKERFISPRKLTSHVKKIIDEKLTNEQWSPMQIAGFCKSNNVVMVSHESIYKYIYDDKQRGGNLYKHLRIASKPYRKRYGSKDHRGKIANRISIDNRPEIINNRERVGDWEADLIIGKNHRGALLTLVERKTLFVQIVKLDTKSADEVCSKMINQLAPYKPFVKSITSDNGTEFTNHQKIAQKLNADFFFTHPYSAWEKGCNENMNGLIRQYFPKGTDFTAVSTHDVNIVEHKLNNRPRQSLNFKYPIQQFIFNFNPTQTVALDT